MKIDRRGLLTALSGGAVFLGAYGGARAVLQARREGQYRLGRLKNGPELAMVFAASSTCAACLEPDLPEHVERLKLLLSRAAGSRDWSFACTGIAVDRDPETGVRFLGRFGRFDETLAGRSWVGVGCREYLKPMPGPIVTPQVIVLSRHVSLAESMVHDERPVLQKAGLSAIRRWAESGAPLPPIDAPATGE